MRNSILQFNYVAFIYICDEKMIFVLCRFFGDQKIISPRCIQIDSFIFVLDVNYVLGASFLYMKLNFHVFIWTQKKKTFFIICLNNQTSTFE